MSRVEVTYEYMYGGSLRPGGNQGSVDLMTSNPNEPTVFATATITAVETNKANLHSDTLIIKDADDNTVTFTYDQTVAQNAAAFSHAFLHGIVYTCRVQVWDVL